MPTLGLVIKSKGIKMESIINFAIPARRINIKVASAIAGSLGKPSKMPGLSYGISATLCKVGAKLAKIPGSTCHECYALKANYKYPSVTKGHAKRYSGLSSLSWVDSMVKLIGRSNESFFRWHDSGDLQDFQHLLNIVTIAERLPGVQFWIPTREKGLVNQYLRAFGQFPDNLCVRVSAAMIDGEAPKGFENTSTVHDKEAPKGFRCKAPDQGNKCLDCRACWDKSIKNVSYGKH
jgi:hypothetical protein